MSTHSNAPNGRDASDGAASSNGHGARNGAGAKNGLSRYQSEKVRVAIIGVGNCASAFVQGVHYYADADPQADGDKPQDAFETLSPREFQVFTLMVEGVRAKEIAARLRCRD